MSEKKKKTTGRRGNNEGSIYKRKDGRWCCQEWIVVFRIVDVVSSTVENLFAQAAHIEKEFGECILVRLLSYNVRCSLIN